MRGITKDQLCRGEQLMPLRKYEIDIWQEDECAPDAESVQEAFPRMFPQLKGRSANGIVDVGDAVFYFYEYGWIIIIVCSSYRSNNSISVVQIAPLAATYEKALRYYADRDNYVEHIRGQHMIANIEDDMGQKARTALED